MSTSEFRKELQYVLNRFSRENGSDTPDFLLADYLVDCLEAFDRAVTRREEWYGRAPVSVIPPSPPPEGAPP